MAKEEGSRRYASIVVLMCCMAAATIGVAQNTPGVFYAPVSEDLGVLTGTYSFFGTMQLLSIALMSLVVPRLLKTFGIKWMVLMSMFCMVVSTVVLAFATSIRIIFLCGALRGVGCALCANIPITIIINNWFQAKNGTATSIALSFSGLAGAVFSPVLTWSIGAFGWRIAYLVQAGILVACMLPPLVLPLHVSPQEEGLLPLGAEPGEEAPRPQAAAKPAKAGPRIGVAGKSAASVAPAGAVDVPFAFKSAAFVCFASFVFLHCLITGLAQHISGYAQSIGMTAGFGALLLSLSMVGNILSKLVIGMLTDKLGALRSSLVMLVANVLALALILIGARTATRWMLVVGSSLYGSVYAVAAVGIALLTRRFFGDANYSKAYPTLSFISSVGCAVAIPAIGYVYDFTGAYDYAVIACLVIHVIDFVLIVRASRAASAAKALEKVAA